MPGEIPWFLDLQIFEDPQAILLMLLHTRDEIDNCPCVVQLAT